MKLLTKLLLLLIIPLNSFSQDPSLVFAKTILGDYSDVHSVLFDVENNSYQTGTFIGTVDLDPGTNILTANSVGGPFQANDFIIKTDSLGNLIWARNFQTNASPSQNNVFIDSAQNVFMVSTFSQTIDVDPGPAVVNVSPTGGGINGILIKLDVNGDLQWYTKIGDAGNLKMHSILIDELGSIFVTGEFNAACDFDLQGPLPIIPSNGSDGFVFKATSDGVILWVKTLTGTGTCSPLSINQNSIGNLIIGGVFNEMVSFEFENGNEIFHSGSGNSCFITTIDTTANCLWTKIYGNSNTGLIQNVAIDHSDNICITGRYTGYVEFDPGNGLGNFFPQGNGDLYILKLTLNGAFVWAKSIGDNQNQAGTGIATDVHGNIYVTGVYEGSAVDFDPNIGYQPLPSSTGADAFILKLDALGYYVWAYNTGGPNVQQSSLIRVNKYGEVLTCGYMLNELFLNAFVAPTLTGTPNSYNCYFYKINQCANNSIQTESACSNYTWPLNGTTYYSSTDSATVILNNLDGCDSLVRLKLTVDQEYFGVESITACESYIWIDGVNYTSSTTTPIVTLTNINGCDSVINLNLTIYSSSQNAESITACDSYSWIDGNTYYSSTNNPIAVLSSINGCDSIIQLDLTINHSSLASHEIISCGQFTWIDGNTYTSSTNTPQFIVSNQFGCDSTITLNLTIPPVDTTLIEISACGDYFWEATNQSYSVEGDYYSTIQSQFSCDSVLHLDLSLLPTITAQVINDNHGGLISQNGVLVNWLDCTTGLIIPAENQNLFEPEIEGYYAAIVSNLQCLDTSDCTFFDPFANINENSLTSSLKIYPNPNDGFFYIEFENNEIDVKITDINGKILRNQLVKNGDLLDISIFEAGVYFLRLDSPYGELVKRIVKK